MTSIFLIRNLKEVIITICLVFSLSIHSGCNAQERPELFFREDWNELPPSIPVNQKHVKNLDLTLGLYGPGLDSIKKSHHDTPLDDPYYVWSGICVGNWAVTLRKNNSFVDLSGYAKILWRSKQSGFRCLHLILKLSNGQWLISDLCDCRSSDWRIYQFNVSDITWSSLDIRNIIEGKIVENPDLSKVDEKLAG